MEKNREKAWYHYYVTDRKWWTRLVRNVDPVFCQQLRTLQVPNGLDNFYIPTSNLAICFFVLEDSGPSAETCFDTERSACPQAAAFLSRRTHITPSTYVYTPFVSDLVLAKSVAVGKTPRQALLFDCLLYRPHIAWARCHHYETGSTLRTNRVHHFRSVT